MEACKSHKTSAEHHTFGFLSGSDVEKFHWFLSENDGNSKSTTSPNATFAGTSRPCSGITKGSSVCQPLCKAGNFLGGGNGGIGGGGVVSTLSFS